MMVILIPLFLAASIGVSEDDWRYGPEMIYDVKIDDAAYHDGQSDRIFWYNITTRLHCRPKSRLCLSCQFHDDKDVMKESNSPENSQDSLNDDPIKHDSFDDGPLELKFGAYGLEEVIVSSSIIPSKLDTMRAIVAQLNLGADFSLEPKDEFEIAENFTTGTCKTKYVLSSKETTEKDMKKTKHPYEIFFVPGMRMPEGEIKEIQRTRNLKDCSYRIDYIFGSRESYKAAHKIIDTKVEASKSHMIISERDFVSWTENTIIVKKLNTTITVAERITLTLDAIIPASGPLPKIQDASSASIFPTRWLHDDSSSSEDSNDFS